MEQTIEIPADTKTVTLEIGRHCGLTLRSLLPQINDEVELVVEDVFGKMDTDFYRLKASNGDSLLHKLLRSRVVDGKALLDLAPSVNLVSPQPTMLNGTFATLTNTGYIQLAVEQPVPED